MNFDPNIHAELVFDGGTVSVPERLGVASANQLQGTPLEQLAELAGRVCYDSLGAPKSRDSVAYHAHIREVGHLSVYEHCAFTVEFVSPSDLDMIATAFCAANRPGVFLGWNRKRRRLRYTLNLRSWLEWMSHAALTPLVKSASWGGEISNLQQHWVNDALGEVVRPLAPMVAAGFLRHTDGLLEASLVVPETDDEKWVSLLMCGSRGMSHELVRHGDWTAISQRSTRYVDEANSPWVEHPLISAWRFKKRDRRAMGDTEGSAQQEYGLWVEELEEWLTKRDIAKFTARKQARGAARGYLGNALYTELIFSASVAQWRRMLRQRCSDAADAEIRVLFAKALRELQRSRYGDRFADMALRPATDGIGEVIA